MERVCVLSSRLPIGRGCIISSTHLLHDFKPERSGFCENDAGSFVAAVVDLPTDPAVLFRVLDHELAAGVGSGRPGE